MQTKIKLSVSVENTTRTKQLFYNIAVKYYVENNLKTHAVTNWRRSPEFTLTKKQNTQLN